MRRAHVVGLGVALWAALAALPAQAVVLRYAPAVGGTTTYQLGVKGDINMKLAGKGEADGKLSFTTSIVEKALAKQDNGTKVEMRLAGGKVVWNFPWQDTPDVQQWSPSTAVLVLDGRGRMVQVVSLESGEQSNPSALPGLQDWGVLVGYGGLPEGDVKAGEVWTDEAKVPVSAMMPEMTLQVKSQLVELSDYQGRKVAKISSTFTGPISRDLSRTPLQGTMSGTVQGDYTSYYDYEKSVYVHTDGHFTMETTYRPSEAESGPASSMHTKHTLVIEMNVAK